MVRRIFDDFVAGSYSMRRICRRLYEDGIPSPTGKATWSIACLSQMLRNSTYKGHAVYNRHQAVPPANGRKSTRNKLRPREEWIEIPVPAVVSEELFDAAQRVSRDHSYFSPPRSTPDRWLLRRLVVCGHCGSRPTVRTARDGMGAASAITSAIGGAHLRPAVLTGRVRSPQPAPRRWRRWCGTSSARCCSTQRPYGKGRLCSAPAGANRTMSC